MAIVLDWAGPVVGSLGVLYAIAVLMASRSAGRGGPLPAMCPFRQHLVPLGGALVALVVGPFVLTLFRQAPFAPGGRLGWGFLIGGLFGLVAAWMAPLVRGLAPADLPAGRQWVVSSAISAGLWSWTLLGSTATLLGFRSAPTDALMGFALGFVAVALLTRAAGDATGLLAGGQAQWRALEPQAVLAVVLSAAGCLAVYHYGLRDERLWWSLPSALVALSVLAAILVSRLAGLESLRERTRLPLAVTLGSTVVAGLGMLLATKLLQSWPMLGCVGLGLVGAGLVVWLAVSATDPNRPATALQTAALAGILAIGLVAVCFRLLAGYGVALALCAASVVLIPALAALALEPPEPQTARRVSGAALTPFLAGLALVLPYRLFLERYAARPFEATVHYSFVGAAMGVMVTLLVAGYGLRTLRPRPGAPGPVAWFALGRAVLLGLVAVVLPLILVVLWGHHTAAGLLAGLVIGALVLAAWNQPSRPAGDLAPGTCLYGLGMALVAVQLTHVLEPLLGASRGTKLWVALASLAIALLWVLVDAAVRAGRGAEEVAG